MELIEIILLNLFSWGVITVLLSWLFAASYPWLRSGLSGCSASLRTSFTLLFALAPGFLALVVLAIYSNEYWSAYFVFAHCHDTSCEPHSLHMPVTTHVGFISLGIGIGAFLIIGLLLFRQILTGRKYLQALEHLSNQDACVNYRVLETDVAVAWCAGILRPQIYLSQGLLQKLNPTQLTTILAHEHAHVVHRDNMRKQLLHWSTVLWPKPVATRIRNDFVCDIELVCDMSAILSSKSGLHDIDSTLSLVNEYCSAGDKEHSAQRSSARLSLLKRELGLLSDKSHGLKYTFLAKASVTCMLLLLGTTYLSHPLIEWLSR